MRARARERACVYVCVCAHARAVDLGSKVVDGDSEAVGVGN